MRLPSVVLAALIGVFLQPLLVGQAGLARGAVGPGEGPRTDYHDEDWEYWWYLNQEPLLAVRRQELLDLEPGAQGTSLGLEDLERVAVALKGVAGEGTDPGLRAAALVALARTGLRDVLPVLRDALEDEALAVRRAAAQAIGILGDPSAIPLLDACIRDRKVEAELRFTAALALGLLDPAAPARAPAERTRPPIPVVLRVHDAACVSLAWSGDGTLILTTGADGTLRLWSAPGEGPDSGVPASREPLPRATGARVAAFAPDGEQLAAAGDGAVVLWHRRAEKTTATLAVTGPVAALAFDPERGERLLVADGGTARIHLTRTGRVLATCGGHSAAVADVAWRPQADHVATASADGSVRVWFARSGNELARHDAHDGPVQAVAYAPDGERLASGGADGRVLVQSGTRGKLGELAAFAAAVNDLAWSPDGAHLAVALADGTLEVLRAGDGERALVADASPRGATALAWAPDGARIACGDADGTLRVIRFAPPEPDPRPAGDRLRSAVADAFARLLDPDAFFQLEPRVQQGVALGAGLTGVPALVPIVDGLLERRLSLNGVTRAWLVLTLGRLGDVAAGEFLRETLGDDDVHARRSAALALGTLFAGSGDADAARALVRQDDREADASTRNFIAIAIGRIQGPPAAAVPLLQRLLEGRQGVLAHNGVVVAPRIRLGARSRQPFAAFGLALARDGRGHPLVMERFAEEREHSVRAALGLALGVYGDRRAAKAVRVVFEAERDPVLRSYLALALGLLGDVGAVPDLLQILEREVDLELVPAAARALWLLGEPRGVSALLDRLARERRPGTRQAVLYALGRTGDASALEALLLVLGDQEEPAGTRRYAAVALGHLACDAPVDRWTRISADFNYPAEPTLFQDLLSTP